MSDEVRVFEEKPFTIAIFTTIALLVVWVLSAVLVAYLGPPTPDSKFARMGITSSGSVWTFFFLISLFVLALVWLMISFMKHLTIVCDTEGFTVYSKSFWDSAETERKFKWSDALGTYHKPGNKGAKSLMVMLPGEELHLMGMTILNKKEYDELASLFDERIRAAHETRSTRV